MLASHEQDRQHAGGVASEGVVEVGSLLNKMATFLVPELSTRSRKTRSLSAFSRSRRAMMLVVIWPRKVDPGGSFSGWFSEDICRANAPTTRHVGEGLRVPVARVATRRPCATLRGARRLSWDIGRIFEGQRKREVVDEARKGEKISRTKKETQKLSISYSSR